MNRFLTIASSGLIASGLAILPISAFAQVAAAPTTATTPAKTAAPMTQSTATAAPAMTGTAKSDMKAPAHPAKTEVHGMNSVKTHHAVVKTPATSVQAKG